MAEVEAGAVAPVEPVTPAPGAVEPVSAPDAPVTQEGAVTDPVQPKTYTEDEHKRLVAEQVNQRLSKERRRLERVAKAEAEAAYLRKQLEERDRQQQPQAKGKPQYKDYEGRPEEFVEALAEWTIEQREAQRAKAEEPKREEREAQEVAAAKARFVAEKIFTPGKAKYPDFLDVVTDEETPFDPAMVEAAARLKNGADVLYHLGKNPAEFQRIFQLPSNVEVAWEMKELGAKLAAPAKPTAAPAPIVPSNANAAVKKDYADMSTAEHVNAWVNRKKR